MLCFELARRPIAFGWRKINSPVHPQAARQAKASGQDSFFPSVAEICAPGRLDHAVKKAAPKAHLIPGAKRGPAVEPSQELSAGSFENRGPSHTRLP